MVMNKVEVSSLYQKMSEKSQLTTLQRATKLCVSSQGPILYMVKSLLYRGKPRQTQESWALPQSPVALSMNRYLKFPHIKSSAIPPSPANTRQQIKLPACSTLLLIMFSVFEVQRWPTHNSFFIWQCVPSPFPRLNSWGTQLPRMYQTSHLQNADPLWKPNNYSQTQPVFKHARSTESELLHLTCSETQKSPHKTHGYKWETMK